jgi:ubiquinone/menaquinone biosynthesis C-methylase UbiE
MFLRRLQARDAAVIRPEELTVNRIYDSFAPRYGFDVNANLSARLKYDLALKYLKPGDNVLDVGCANGIHMRLLAGRCRHITGIDINQPMLDIARTTLAEDGIANASLELRSATDLGIADASFDLVYSFSTLTLVPDVERALQEIRRVLRPGGIALIDFAGRWNLSHLYWDMYYRRHGHFGQRAFGYREAVMQLGALGLKVVESHALGFLDQWRYVPGLHWCKWLDQVFHASLQSDLDYRASNLSLFFPLANRWYLACRKGS